MTGRSITKIFTRVRNAHAGKPQRSPNRLRARGNHELKVLLPALAAFTMPLVAHSHSAAQYDLNIQPQPLAQVLQELANQSGIQIIFFSKLTDGRDAPALSGTYTAESALGTVLSGTGLTFHQLNDRTIEVQPQAVLLSASNNTSSGRAPQVADNGLRAMQSEGSILLAQAGGSPRDNQTRQEATAAPAPAQKAEPEEKLATIVITGSRLITNGNEAPTPVTVMNLEEMAATKPTTVFQQLADLPAFNGSGGASGIPTRGIFAGNNNGASALNLRGLGANRALVLFDGHRMPQSTPTGEVDINLMPQMLMQRVDVVTGGASAVYGSDAVSGVMNFVIDRKFNGLKIDAQGGRSSRHDDGSYNVGIAAGTDLFGGRGHIEASIQHNGGDGLSSYLKRPALLNWTLQGNGSAANPYHPVQGVTISNFSFGGQVQGFGPSPPYKGYNFSQNGVLTPRIPGSTAGIVLSNRQIGGDGAYVTVTAMKAKTRLDQFFTRFDYDLTDNVHAFANLGGALDYSYAGSMPSLDFFLDESTCSAFLPAQYQAGFGCTDPTDVSQQLETFSFNKLPDPRYSNLKTTYTSVYQRNYSFIGGLEGSFADNYHWDSTYTFSETKQDVRNDGVDLDQHFFAAMDAVVNPATSKIVCNITLTNPGLQDGCVPLNIFGPSAESQAAVDYSFGRVERWTTNKMQGLAGSLRGEPLNDWAGPVGVAVSGEYRHQTMELTSNASPDPIDCTGIRFNCVQGETYKFGNTIQGLPQVQQDVAEGAVEFNMPLIKDAPFAKSLSLDTAGRYTRYNNKGNGVTTSINANTWKAGLVWNMNDALTFRWTRSRDIRAPNMWELFNPVALTAFTPGAVDYLTGNDLQAQAAPQQTGGNPYLEPEIGLTTTVGIVWKPTADFSVSIDGYLINLKHAIAVAPGANQDNQLACYNSGGTSPYCDLQTRALGSYTSTDPANYVTKWFNQGINIGAIKTSGIDLEANYRTDLANRTFSLRGLVAYKPHIIYSQAEQTTIDQAGAAYCGCGVGALLPNPVWRAQLFANYNITDSFAINLSERWRSSLYYQGDRTKIESGGGVPAFYTTSLNMNYTLPIADGKISAYLNVQNVFDKLAPPVGSTGVSGSQPGDFGSYALGDDFVGRYFTLGVRARL